MMFLIAASEPTVFVMMTDQDVSDMRNGGRTMFIDQLATGGAMFNRIVLSVHKSQAAIEEALTKAGHGKLLQGMPSHNPTPLEGVCAGGCHGVMAETLLYKGKCIACWQESAESYRRQWLEELKRWDAAGLRVAPPAVDEEGEWELYAPAHNGSYSTDEFRRRFKSEKEAEKFAAGHFGCALVYQIQARR